LGKIAGAEAADFNDNNWKKVHVPHDWSIEEGYQEKGDVASSTGFVPGGIGWYRKSFVLETSDKDRVISILFDGVYNNSTVYLNGNLLGHRPNGYISFSYDLNDYLRYDGQPNVIAVKVDRSAYVDSRWYTGSGIYRNVTLVKKSALHIKQWGTRITTPEVSAVEATVKIKTKLSNESKGEGLEIKLSHKIYDSKGGELASQLTKIEDLNVELELRLENPSLWSPSEPYLYTLETDVLLDGVVVDQSCEVFGIRKFRFDAEKGFFLNGSPLKIKGVNLHHDAGAVGAAVPKAVWEYRVQKLKSIGTNAIRFAHNPHSPELLEVCDELGMLVMNEAFDEWSKPKDKSKVYLGDNAAGPEASRAYPSVFNEWAERDLKDLIRRDYNHPSVFMWSIGNEIEWTYPHYSKTYNEVNTASDAGGYEYQPIYDVEKIKPIFDQNVDGTDPLSSIAKKLVAWVKEEDLSRPTVGGSVLPSVAMVSGYGTSLDVLAYLGEAGPWPRKGLNISFFDFAGFKTPRGHFYETLWKDEAKVYMVTTPAEDSEFSFTEEDGWKFEMKLTPPPVWKMLRLWEWYQVEEKWSYEVGEEVIVQVYTNCEEVELFLDDSSLGRKSLSDVLEEDHILKWLVPYKEGILKAVGYNDGEMVEEFVLRSPSNSSHLVLRTSKNVLSADGYDVAIVELLHLDENGTRLTDVEKKVTFHIEGGATNIGVDNGWEMNVQDHKTDSITTHNGRALVYVQAGSTKGRIAVTATSGGMKSNVLDIKME